jgi:membrane protease YdiL (CAAX protease family)
VCVDALVWLGEEDAVIIDTAVVIAAVLTLVPLVGAAFFAGRLGGMGAGLPTWVRLLRPAVLGVPYLLVASSAGMFRWGWLAVYAGLPVAVAGLLWMAGRVDAEKRGCWLDFVVLGTLGLAVDLRWFEPAWPAHLAVFSKILLLDAGIYGFQVIRRLDGVGFDLRLRRSDLKIGLREVLFYTPIAIPIGLGLGFLHGHGAGPGWVKLMQLPASLVFTFFFIAVPEELFFRGWVQNLLERRMGRYGALGVTAVLFGLSHWNKRTTNFNWQYVLLAALAGVFYGRAWRRERRVGASAVTHAVVDTIWSFWLR